MKPDNNFSASDQRRRLPDDLDPEFRKWLDGHHPGPVDWDESVMFRGPDLLAAYEFGRAWAPAGHWLLAAAGMLSEAMMRFREYEAHHRAKVTTIFALGDCTDPAADAAAEKAERNAEIAQRIGDLLLKAPKTENDLLTELEAALSRVAELIRANGECAMIIADNLDIMQTLWEARPENWRNDDDPDQRAAWARLEDALLGAPDEGPGKTIDVASPGPREPVEVSTSDPRFDPARPVRVNGFTFVPEADFLAVRKTAIDAKPCVAMLNHLATCSNAELLEFCTPQQGVRDIAKATLGDEGFPDPLRAKLGQLILDWGRRGGDNDELLPAHQQAELVSQLAVLAGADLL